MQSRHVQDREFPKVQARDAIGLNESQLTRGTPIAPKFVAFSELRGLAPAPDN